ncbi:MAG: DJ-1/PfpI family protein [Deltaproteobacteria bacterium]|nr:DJ-1/PfpI family protein [Deltaproteobacteria bacterium]
MNRTILITVLTAALAWPLSSGCKPKAEPAGPEGKEAGEQEEVGEPAGEPEGEEAEETEETEEKPVTAGKKAVMIIACKDFQDDELAEPKKALEEAGVAVTVASTSTEGCKGMMGTEVTPDELVEDLDADDFDIAVFVGGSGSAAFYDDEDVLEFARASDDEGLVIGAICLAPGILARAGILDGLKATAYDAEKARNALEEGGATYTGETVTVDGVVVTGNGPGAAKEFGAKLVEILE